MDLTKYYNKGLTGMANLGNTCFLNSCMQVINHTYELNEILDNNVIVKYVKEGIDDTIIFNEWNELRNVLWSRNGVVAPKKFVHYVHLVAEKKDRDLFTGYSQNDMPEFLQFFIDCIHNSISRKVHMKINGKPKNNRDIMAKKCLDMLKDVYSCEYSEIMELFYGIYVSEIISGDLKQYYAMKPEQFFILDLPIVDESNHKQLTHLYQCFDQYIHPERLAGDNAWYNEKTKKKEDVVKQISFWSLPRILVIVLKRFTPDGQYKITSNIDIPVNDLDLSRYVKNYNPSSNVYDLYGICNHYGGISDGHYTACVRNAENKWIYFNDEEISIIQDEKSVVTSNAYCLFYRKK